MCFMLKNLIFSFVPEMPYPQAQSGEWVSLQCLPLLKRGKGRIWSHPESLLGVNTTVPQQQFFPWVCACMCVCKKSTIDRGLINSKCTHNFRHTHWGTYIRMSDPLILCWFCQFSIREGFIFLVFQQHHMLMMLLKLQLRFPDLAKIHWFHLTCIHSARRIFRNGWFICCFFSSNH